MDYRQLASKLLGLSEQQNTGGMMGPAPPSLGLLAAPPQQGTMGLLGQYAPAARSLFNVMTPDYLRQPDVRDVPPGTIGKVPQNQLDPFGAGAGAAVDIASMLTPAGVGKMAMAAGMMAKGARRSVREVASEVERELQRMGFTVRADHSGSLAGDSSYLTPVMDTPFGPMYPRRSVRVSDHAVGPGRYGDHLHVSSDAPDMSALDPVRGMAGDIKERVSRLTSLRDAITQNTALSAEIAKAPKDTGRAYKLAKEAGIAMTVDDMATVLRAMNR